MAAGVSNIEDDDEDSDGNTDRDGLFVEPTRGYPHVHGLTATIETESEVNNTMRTYLHLSMSLLHYITMRQNLLIPTSAMELILMEMKMI